MINANGGLSQQRVAVHLLLWSFPFFIWFYHKRMHFNISSPNSLIILFPVKQFVALTKGCTDKVYEIGLQICNAVAVARMLNATLVLPKFLFNSVWIDSRCYSWSYFYLDVWMINQYERVGLMIVNQGSCFVLVVLLPALQARHIFHCWRLWLCGCRCSQFGDLYEEDYFIQYLKDDVRVVKELPFELQSLDLDAIEAVVSSALILVSWNYSEDLSSLPCSLSSMA